MKKIIIGFLLAATCLLIGCSDDEVIELLGEAETSIDATMSDDDEHYPDKSIGNVEAGKNNIEETAWNTDTSDSEPFVVYVTGEVIKPGVYELKQGSRIIDALSEAGGYSENASETYLNLAEVISDGQMIYVPSDAEIENGTFDMAMTSGGNTGGNTGLGTGKDNKSDLVNLNTASKEELMTLPGIGESKAEKIIAYRETNGKFSSPEGIMQISGIKDGLYNKIKDRICVK